MKKILFYTDTPLVGGAEGQMLLLASHLNRQEFEPLLLCGNNESLDDWCAKFEREKIKVFRVPSTSKHSPKHYFTLLKIIKEEKIDLLHVHAWNPASCRYAFSAGKKASIPIITTEHDPFQLSFFKDLLKKLSLHKIAQIVTVSENNKLILSALYPRHKNKITVIHNGIDTNWWQSQTMRFGQDDRLDVKKEVFKAKEDTLIILSIAQLHPRKGLKYLIEAIKLLTPIFPNIKLIIVGQGPQHGALQNLIQKLKLTAHVALIGNQKNIPQLLKSANIFTLPSLREAFGLVNVEAMISELPIVATKVGGIPEIVKDHQTGLLVEPENAEKLAKALQKLIESPELRVEYGKKGQQIALTKFDAKTMAAKYQALYSKFLAN